MSFKKHCNWSAACKGNRLQTISEHKIPQKHPKNSRFCGQVQLLKSLQRAFQNETSSPQQKDKRSLSVRNNRTFAQIWVTKTNDPWDRHRPAPRTYAASWAGALCKSHTAPSFLFFSFLFSPPLGVTVTLLPLHPPLHPSLTSSKLLPEDGCVPWQRWGRGLDHRGGGGGGEGREEAGLGLLRNPMLPLP